MVSCIVVLLLKPSYIVNLLIVYVPPTLLNLYWLRERQRNRILMFAVVTTVLFAIPIELISRLADAWDVASIFPRIYGIAPIENLFYAFINFLWPLAFYEYFIDKGRFRKISSRFKILLVLYIALFVATFLFMQIDSGLLAMNYWLVGVFVLIIPLGTIAYLGSIPLRKVLIPTLFFGVVFFIHESISMELGHWWWPGEYILETSLFGHRFPVDDVIIWYVLSTPALLIGYEYFVDDNR